MIYNPNDLPERVRQKIAVQPNECWEWTAGKRKGYGALKWQRRDRPAHRVVYELLESAIPDGLVLDHLCRHPSCVNPAHLEPVTHQVNCQRGDIAKAMKRLGEAITHCKNGHEYTPENTIIRTGKQGKRNCRECGRQVMRRLAARKAQARIEARGKRFTPNRDWEDC